MSEFGPGLVGPGGRCGPPQLKIAVPIKSSEWTALEVVVLYGSFPEVMRLRRHTPNQTRCEVQMGGTLTVKESVVSFTVWQVIN